MWNQTHELASRWKRLGGVLLDTLIAIVVTFPVAMGAGALGQTPEAQELTVGQRAFFLILGLVAFLLVNGYLLARRGQTVGKMLVGTRIVSAADERILSLGHVFGLRYLPFFAIAQIPTVGGMVSLVDCLLIFRKDKRCLHDLVAGTIVVNVSATANLGEPYGAGPRLPRGSDYR